MAIAIILLSPDTWSITATVMAAGWEQMVPGWMAIPVPGREMIQAGGSKILQAGSLQIRGCG